jgi:hypothetical protein
MKRFLTLLFSVFFLLGTACTTNVYNNRPEAVTNYNIGYAYRSVVLLKISSPSGKTMSASGFAYDKNRIITAGHFCISALEVQIFESHTQDIKMQFYDENFELKTRGNVVVEDISKVQDICVLRKEDHGLFTLPIIKNYSEVKLRDKTTIVGIPSGIAMGEFNGRVMSLFYNGIPLTVRGMLVVSSASTGGISGSPIILDRTGEVIGVLVRGHVFFDHLSFGVNANEVNKFLKSLK